MTGTRGRPSKPTELRLLQGNPGDAKINQLEPKPEKLEGVEPPAWLCDQAKEIWRVEAPKMERLGLLTEIDLNAFGRYCDLLFQHRRVSAFLASVPRMYYPIYHEQSAEDIAQGRPKVIKYLVQYPEVNIHNQLCSQLKSLEREFGMTPASRVTIQVQPARAGEKEDLERALFG